MLVYFIVWTALSAIDAKTDNVNSGLGIGIIVLIFLFNLGYALKYVFPWFHS